MSLQGRHSRSNACRHLGSGRDIKPASYGIAACFCLVTDSEYNHTREGESQLLDRVSGAGAFNGVTGKKELSLDGLPRSINELVVDLIWKIAGA